MHRSLETHRSEIDGSSSPISGIGLLRILRFLLSGLSVFLLAMPLEVSAQGTLGTRMRSGSLGEQIVGNGAGSPSSELRFPSSPPTDRSTRHFGYRGLVGPRGYTGLGNPTRSERLGRLRELHGFRGFGAFPGLHFHRSFHGLGGLFVSLHLRGLLVRLGFMPPHAFSRRGLFWAPGWALYFLSPPIQSLLLPPWGASWIAPEVPTSGPDASRGYWEEDALLSEEDHPNQVGIGPERLDRSEADTPVSESSRSQMSTIGTPDCAVVEVRYASGASVSTWVPLPTEGADSAEDFEVLLDTVGQPGAPEERRRVRSALVPPAAADVAEISVSPCGSSSEGTQAIE